MLQAPFSDQTVRPAGDAFSRPCPDAPVLCSVQLRPFLTQCSSFVTVHLCPLLFWSVATCYPCPFATCYPCPFPPPRGGALTCLRAPPRGRPARCGSALLRRLLAAGPDPCARNGHTRALYSPDLGLPQLACSSCLPSLFWFQLSDMREPLAPLHIHPLSRCKCPHPQSLRWQLAGAVLYCTQGSAANVGAALKTQQLPMQWEDSEAARMGAAARAPRQGARCRAARAAGGPALQLCFQQGSNEVCVVAKQGGCRMQPVRGWRDA